MSGSAADDVSQRLEAVYRRHDLQPRDLTALDTIPLPVCPNDYWTEEALPRAAALVAAVDDLLVWTERSDDDRAGSRGHLSPPAPVLQVSRWWHRRLRRAAITRSIPAVLLATPIEAELVVARSEMALLDRAPWSHADRLLSAFELAHVEIERRLGNEPSKGPGFFRLT